MHQPTVREHTGDQRGRRGHPRQFAGQLGLSEKHGWNEAEAQRIGLAFMRSQRELHQQINRRADADDGERCHRRPVAAGVVVSIGKEHVGNLPHSLYQLLC